MKILEYFKHHTKEEREFDLLPDCVFVLEHDGKVIDVNDKALELYETSRFEILGRYFSDFVENGTQILNKIITNGSIAVAKGIDQKKGEGNKKEFLCEVSAKRNLEDGKVYVAIRNATDKQKEQLEINEKYENAKKIIEGKNDFLLESSGAILSKIVSITGFSKAILDGIGGALSDKQKKYLNLINSNSYDLSYDLEKLFTLFQVESGNVEYKYKPFDLISLIKSIERVYEKNFKDKEILFSMDYSNLSQRDCFLDSEVVEYILRCIMEIFLRFSNLGKCSLNIGHPPLDFLKTREFDSNDKENVYRYVLFEAKIADLVFSQDELDNIFNTYYKSSTKRSIGLKASITLLKNYIKDFKGDIWVYSKQNFGTMFTFVLPLK